MAALASPRFELRHGTLSDLPQVYRLNRLAFLEAWSLRALEEAFEQGCDLRVCTAPDQRLAAYYLGQDVLDEIHILQLAVAPPFRRKGLATCLMREILAEKRSDRFKQAHLEVRISNLPAIRLYRSLGFEAIGIRRGYYVQPPDREPEDALLMSKAL